MTMISSTNFWCNRAIDFLTAYSFQYEHKMQVLISPSNITQILYEHSYEVKWQRRILKKKLESCIFEPIGWPPSLEENKIRTSFGHSTLKQGRSMFQRVYLKIKGK